MGPGNPWIWVRRFSHFILQMFLRQEDISHTPHSYSRSKNICNPWIGPCPFGSHFLEPQYWAKLINITAVPSIILDPFKAAYSQKQNSNQMVNQWVQPFSLDYKLPQHGSFPPSKLHRTCTSPHPFIHASKKCAPWRGTPQATFFTETPSKSQALTLA